MDEATVREALTDDDAWQRLVDTCDHGELLELLRRLDAEAKERYDNAGLRIAEIEAAVSAGRVSSREVAARKMRDHRRRHRAKQERRALRPRIDELRREEGARAGARYARTVEILAAAVYLHQCERIDDGDLYELLDDLPGFGGGRTLREGIADGEHDAAIGAVLDRDALRRYLAGRR